MHKALPNFPKVHGVCLTWNPDYSQMEVRLTNGQNKNVDEPELLTYGYDAPQGGHMEMVKYLLRLAKGKDPSFDDSDDESSEDDLSTGMVDGL